MTTWTNDLDGIEEDVVPSADFDRAFQRFHRDVILSATIGEALAARYG